jgi:acyl carrier protein
MNNETIEGPPSDFPRDEILAALEQWWDGELADSALPGDEAPPPAIMKPAVEIDSHRAVRALVTLEEVVKFEIPETAIKEGGYDSFDEMKAHLISELAMLFEKKRKKVHA